MGGVWKVRDKYGGGGGGVSSRLKCIVIALTIWTMTSPTISTTT